MKKRKNWCVVCNYDTSNLSNETLLEVWNVCRKHTKEIKEKIKPKENKMAACAKCGSQDMVYQQGVSQKNGKQWQGWKCSGCKTMHGMNGIPWGDKKAPQQQTYQPEPKFQARPPMGNPVGNLGPTIKDIMTELKKMQEFMGMVNPIEQANEELQIEANPSEPF